jgi:molecular chaperone GrpE
MKKKTEKNIDNNDQITAEEVAPTSDTAVEATTDAVDPLEALQKENAILNDKLLRLGAEFQNTMKRTDRQVVQSRQFAIEGFIKSLLPMMDNYEATIQSAGSDNCDVASVAQGVQMIYESLNTILAAQDFAVISVKAGDPFDPNIHQALMRQESEEIKENCIITELGKGYMIGDKTIRPANVSVATKPVVSETAEAAE